MTHYDDKKETFRCEHGKVRGATMFIRRCYICEPVSPEEEAREILERILPSIYRLSAGDVVELANIIHELRYLRKRVEMGNPGSDKLAEDLKPQSKTERLAEVYMKHAGQTDSELATAIADVLEEHDAKAAKTAHEAQFRATEEKEG